MSVGSGPPEFGEPDRRPGHDDPPPFEGAPVPAQVVVKSALRFWWLGGFMLLALLFAAVGATSVGADNGGGWGVVLTMFGLTLFAVLIALSALRWAIVADSDGVSITNYWRPRTIPWSELTDIQLVKVESAIDIGFHYFLFVTRAGKGVRPAAPTGRDRPGGRMRQIRRDLLAMRDHYAPTR